MLAQLGHGKTNAFVAENPRPFAMVESILENMDLDKNEDASFAKSSDYPSVEPDELTLLPIVPTTDKPHTSTEIFHLQIKSQTKEGKKRITPVFLGSEKAQENLFRSPVNSQVDARGNNMGVQVLITLNLYTFDFITHLV